MRILSVRADGKWALSCFAGKGTDSFKCEDSNKSIEYYILEELTKQLIIKDKIFGKQYVACEVIK